MSLDLLFDGYFFVLKGFNLIFEVYDAGLLLFDLFFYEFKGLLLIGGLGEIVKEITDLFELFLGLEGLFFVPFDLLFQSLALLLIFGCLLLEVEGLFLDIVQTGLNGVATAFLIANKILHLVVLFDELPVVSGSDVLESHFGFSYSLP